MFAEVRAPAGMTVVSDRYPPGVTDARYRCKNCGNLTRFDVTTTQRVKAFHHYSVGGELTIEDPEVLGATVESVICRWCGTDDGVEAFTD